MPQQKDHMYFCVMYVFCVIYETLFSCVCLSQKKFSSLGCTLPIKICYSPKHILKHPLPNIILDKILLQSNIRTYY